MGEFVSPRWLQALAWLAAAVIVFLNAKYLSDWSGLSAWIGRVL
jgi:Mn2+/Fe2+ NRAMP family transporter